MLQSSRARIPIYKIHPNKAASQHHGLSLDVKRSRLLFFW